MTCNPRSARSPAANAAAALQLGCILLGLTGGPAAAGEVFYAIASSSLSFGSVSASAGRYFDSYGLVNLDCENLRLELTFPAQLRLGAQTRAGVLEFQCDFDVTLEP